MIDLLATIAIAALITGIAQFKRRLGKLCLYGAALTIIVLIVLYMH